MEKSLEVLAKARELIGRRVLFILEIYAGESTGVPSYPGADGWLLTGDETVTTFMQWSTYKQGIRWKGSTYHFYARETFRCWESDKLDPLRDALEQLPCDIGYMPGDFFSWVVLGGPAGTHSRQAPKENPLVAAYIAALNGWLCGLASDYRRSAELPMLQGDEAKEAKMRSRAMTLLSDRVNGLFWETIRLTTLQTLGV